MQVAADGAKHYVKHGVRDEPEFKRDEGSHAYWNPARLPPNLGRTRRSDDRRHDERHHRRAYPHEDGGNHMVALDGFRRQEDGDEQDDDERRNNGSQRRRNAPLEAAYAVTHARGDVHRQDAGERLRYGQQVEEILALYPMVLVHYLALDN